MSNKNWNSSVVLFSASYFFPTHFKITNIFFCCSNVNNIIIQKTFHYDNWMYFLLCLYCGVSLLCSTATYSYSMWSSLVLSPPWRRALGVFSQSDADGPCPPEIFRRMLAWTAGWDKSSFMSCSFWDGHWFCVWRGFPTRSAASTSLFYRGQTKHTNKLTDTQCDPHRQ